MFFRHKLNITCNTICYVISMVTKTKELRYFLSEMDWIDIRITKDMDKNEIVKFSVNLSSIITGDIHSIIRYDNSHGFTHIDRYGRKKKEVLKNIPNVEVIQIARKDITDNWQKYRKRVERKIEGDKNGKKS